MCVERAKQVNLAGSLRDAQRCGMPFAKFVRCHGALKTSAEQTHRLGNGGINYFMSSRLGKRPFSHLKSMS